MKLDYLKEISESINDFEDFILTGWMLTPNLKVRVNEIEMKPDEYTEADLFRIQLEFHGEHYEATLTKKRLNGDFPCFAMIESFSESNLMSSLVELIEDEFWEHIKVLCLRLEQLEILESSAP
tara:strand:- start:628 stop:996 length:369 start_codon:yes stop_codon:yes gene_type:complete